MQSLIKNFELENRIYTLYQAGLPSFPRNFTRDSIYSLLLVDNAEILRNQLEFCIALQGKTPNPYNGEELGKIFHEYPSVDIAGKGTLYAASDTTALFLLGFQKYLQIGGGAATEFLNTHQQSVMDASKYIQQHIQNGLFTEDPIFSGASEYALKVTYWKDSILLNRQDGKAIYPIVYTLTQAINLSGLKAAAKLLDVSDYDQVIELMKESLQKLYSSELQNYILAKDNMGDIMAETDDFLHMLYFLDVDDIPTKNVESIVAKSKYLETNFGYRTNSADFCSLLDRYHSCTLWPFEQAIIHAGAKKFNLPEVMEVASRIQKFLNTEPEYFSLSNEPEFYETAGCDPQLWTWAAKKYFKNLA